MVALAATNSATPSLQSTLMRGRIYAARQQAQQAEAQAQDLRAQADAQEQLVLQANQRVQTLERGANAVGASKATRPATVQTTTAVQNDTTYAGVLADVYRLAKPLLESDLRPNQKNLVTSSLFAATNAVWSAQQYDSLAANGVRETVGQLIDTKA